jgi:GTPase involved in cell partitioning and DNA repair
VYRDDADCEAGDQWCADSIIHRPLGGITQDKISTRTGRRSSTNWRDATVVTDGNGGTGNVAFPAPDTRYVRMSGVHRGTDYGYSLFEFEVHAH